MKKTKKVLSTSHIKWDKEPNVGSWGVKHSEAHTLYIAKEIYVRVYGGYSRHAKMHNQTGWYIMVGHSRPTNYPNKWLGSTTFKSLKEAKEKAIVAGLCFFASCLIENKKPADMEQPEWPAKQKYRV